MKFSGSDAFCRIRNTTPSIYEIFEFFKRVFGRPTEENRIQDSEYFSTRISSKKTF
jgi:hypothetical protein